MDIVTFEQLINYVIASWLPIGRLPWKVCELVVFNIPLLLYLAQNLILEKKSWTCRRPARSISTCWDRSIKS